KEEERREVGDSGFAERAQRSQFMNAKKSDSDDENDNSEFVEPVGAEGFLDGGDGFQTLLQRGLRNGRRIFGSRNLERRGRPGGGNSRKASRWHFSLGMRGGRQHGWGWRLRHRDLGRRCWWRGRRRGHNRRDGGRNFWRWRRGRGGWVYLDRGLHRGGGDRGAERRAGGGGRLWWAR